MRVVSGLLGWTALGGLAVAVLFGPVSAADAPPAQIKPGDAERGEVVYERCEACHSPDLDRIGPHHRGVVGRKAGSVVGFAYSAALQKAGFVWTEDLLDRWLTNPQQLVPGTKMGYRVNDAQNRADVIAYLKTLK